MTCLFGLLCFARGFTCPRFQGKPAVTHEVSDCIAPELRTTRSNLPVASHIAVYGYLSR